MINPYVDIFGDTTGSSFDSGIPTSGSGFGAFGMDINYDPETYQRTDLDTSYLYDTGTTRQLAALDDYVQQRREEGASADELKKLFAQQSSLDNARQDEEKAVWEANAGNSWIAATPYAMLALSGAPLALGQALGGGAALGSAVLNTGIAAAQGKDIGDMAKTAALSYAGGALGDRIAAGTEFGINPFGEQAGMLADQVSGMSGAYGFLPTALGETSSKLVQGDSLEDAVLSGTLSGLKNADLDTGSLDFDISTPEFLKEFDKAVIRPAGEALSEFDQDVLQPVTKPIAAGAKEIEKATIRPAGEALSEFNKAVLQPTYEVAKDVGRAIDDTLIDPIDEALRNIDLPDIDGPDIDWPDMPDINWPSLFSGGLGAMQLLDGFMGGTGSGGSVTDEFLEGRALKHRLNTDVTVFDKVDINQFNRTT